MDMDDKTQTLLDAAEGALEVGNRESAERLLRQLLEVEPYTAQAWYLLSLAIDSDQREDQISCLRNALVADPNLQPARERLDSLEGVATMAWQTRRTVPLLDELRDEELESFALFSKMEEYGKDPLDDPLQCPYCGAVNPVENTVCTECEHKIIFYEPRAEKPGPQLQMAVLLGGIAAMLGIFEVSTAALWLWYGTLGTDSYLQMGLGAALDSSAGHFLFGDLLRPDFLTGVAANLLLIGGLIRITILAVVWYGAYNRWRWGYYGAVVASGADSFFQIILFLLGLSGSLISVAAAILSMGALISLFTARVDFSLKQARVAVTPDARVKSAAGYYDRGMRFKNRDMWAVAVAHWRKAVGASPRTAEYYRWLGIGYLRLKRYDRAIPVLEEALYLKPGDEQMSKLLRLSREIIAADTQAEREALIRPLWED